MKRLIDRKPLFMRASMTAIILLVIALASRDLYQVVQGTKDLVAKLTLTWGVPFAVLGLIGLLGPFGD